MARFRHRNGDRVEKYSVSIPILLIFTIMQGGRGKIYDVSFRYTVSSSMPSVYYIVMLRFLELGVGPCESPNRGAVIGKLRSALSFSERCPNGGQQLPISNGRPASYSTFLLHRHVFSHITRTMETDPIRMSKLPPAPLAPSGSCYSMNGRASRGIFLTRRVPCLHWELLAVASLSPAVIASIYR